MTELGRTTTLEGLRDILVARRKALGLPQHVVDDLAGYADGYTGKLECGMKGLGKDSVPLLLTALGVEILVVKRDKQAARQFRDKTEDFWSRRMRSLRTKQLLMQSPKQRRKIARAAGKASARKRKAERERRDQADAATRD